MDDETKPRRNVREELALLEQNINRLKIEYEQYFMHILKREPLFLKGQVNKTVVYFSNQYIKNTADKFKFRNLADKFNSYKHYWENTLKSMEAGTYHRRSEGSFEDMPSLPPLTSMSIKNEKEVRMGSSSAQEKKDEEMKLIEVYNSYISEMKKINKPTDNISFDFLKKAVIAQKKKAEERYGTRTLIFKVKSVDGKVKIQIKPK